MSKTTLRSILIVSALGVAISGCSSTSKVLGLTKQSPNEFNILTKAPLVVPPEYNLRPPQAGASSVENNYTQEAARKALIGNVDDAEPTRGEVVLMTKAGVGRANQEIRLEIDGQNSVERKTSSFTDRVLFWNNGSYTPRAGAPLNPETEAQRLESVNSATGGGQVEIGRRPGSPKLPGL